MKKDQENSRKRSFVSGSRIFCATPVFAHNPSHEKLKKLSEDLIGLGQGVQFADALRDNDYQPSSFYESSITEYQKRENTIISRPIVSKILEIICKNAISIELSPENMSFVLSHLLLNWEETVQLEQETVLQSLNNRWYEERRKIITASNFGSIIKRRGSIQPKSIVKNILSNKKQFKSEACQWGIEKEKVAISLYEDEQNVNVESCGLIINPKWPWLGASADGVVNRNSIYRAIEVKCPFSKKNCTIEESCNDPNFYLRYEKDKIKLKNSHPYYYQCQGVMAILELSSSDFIVYTTKDLHIENITFQKKNCDEKILPELTAFYFEFLKDSIFAV